MKHWLETRQVYDRWTSLSAAGIPAALASVVRVRGSAYRHEGAKLLVAQDGSTCGNVSGGCLELDVREVAQRVIHSGASELRQYCSSADQVTAWDLGVGCEGEVEVLVAPAIGTRDLEVRALTEWIPFASCTLVDHREGPESGHLAVTATESSGTLSNEILDRLVVQRSRELLGIAPSGIHELGGRSVFIDLLDPPPELIVISAGDDARALVRVATDVGFRVTVVDHRPGLLTAERFPPPVERVDAEPGKVHELLRLHSDCYAVVMTHNYADDRQYLAELITSAVTYIGMLGPRQRTERILREIGVEATADEDRVYGPVGLDIGTDGAEQVALAVIAEVLAVRSGRIARSLRERHLPIHTTTI